MFASLRIGLKLYQVQFVFIPAETVLNSEKSRSMREAEVKVTLSDGSAVLKEWERHCQADLPEILETVKHVKQSINEYLTQLIGIEKNFFLKEQVEPSDISDGEEEPEGDSVSGFIKVTANANEKSKECNKRQINCVNQVKKLKR